MFFETSSQAREALKRALQERPVRHAVVEMRVKADSDEGKWFGILSLDTESVRNLDYCRHLFPEFRVIGAP